jgi:hypothetical protein
MVVFSCNSAIEGREKYDTDQLNRFLGHSGGGAWSPPGARHKNTNGALLDRAQVLNLRDQLAFGILDANG